MMTKIEIRVKNVGLKTQNGKLSNKTQGGVNLEEYCKIIVKKNLRTNEVCLEFGQL